MKTLLHKIFVLSIVLMSMVLWTMPVKGQMAYVSLDTLQSGDTIHFCTADYSQVTLYKPAAALTNLHWQGGYPTLWNVFVDSVVLNTTNSGPIWFWSDQTPTMALKFFLVGPPISPALPDISACGDVFSYTLNALNTNTGAYYTWSTGETTQTINATSAGTYWVDIDNGCGFLTDLMVLTVDHSNDADVGPDQTICLYDTVTLTTGNANIADYTWSTGAGNVPTIDIYVSGTYSVTTTDTAGCVSVDSMVLTVLSPPVQDIALVTIDTSNGNNRVTWDNLYGEAVTTKIYRELTTNNYVLVGSVPYIDGSFTDTVNSRNQPWRYKISIVDSCTNEGEKSPYVQSIHTWVSEMGGSYTVQWTPYLMEAKEVVDQYNIYYGSQLSQLIYLTFVSGSITVYTTSGFLDSLYVVGAQLSAKGVNDDALSNWIAEDDATGITKNQAMYFEIYPNPATDIISIQSQELLFTIISDLAGRIVLTSREKEINISTLPSGTYLMKVVNATGSAGHKKLIVY